MAKENGISNEVLTAIRHRSSARAYAKEPLAGEQLDAILAAGLQAPTGANRKEIHFTVLKGSNSILEEIDAEMRKGYRQERQAHNFFYEAPTMIFLSAEEGFKWSAIDAGIAVENMAIAAESLGLGTLIIGCIYDAMNGEKKAYFSEKLAFPEGCSFQVALAVGHKTDDKAPHDYDFDSQMTMPEGRPLIWCGGTRIPLACMGG